MLWEIPGGSGEVPESSVGQSRSSKFPQLGNPEVPNFHRWAIQKFQINLELLPWESLGVRGGSSGVPGESPGVLGLPGCSLGASKNIEKTLVFIVFPA